MITSEKREKIVSQLVIIICIRLSCNCDRKMGKKKYISSIFYNSNMTVYTGGRKRGNFFLIPLLKYKSNRTIL